LGVSLLQNRFTAGELDPRFLAQVDFEQYSAGARKLRNVVVTPQGAVSRRFGGSFVDTVVDRTSANAPVTDIEQVALLTYNFSPDETYFIVIRPDTTATVSFDIYLDNVLVDTVAAGGSTYNTTMVRDIRWVEASDRVIFLHNDVPFQQLVRTNSTTWAISAITLQFYPTFDFSSIDGVTYTGSSFTFTPSATTGAVTLTASGNIYTANHVGGLYFGNSGVLRITAVASATSASGYTVEDFAATSAIRGDESLLVEPIWGAGGGSPTGPVRGWPAHGAFYQGRLILGNSPTLPYRGSGSVVNDYYNFDDGETDATAGYSFNAGVGGNDTIQDIIGTKSLVAIGYQGPSATSILLEQATTAQNIFMNSQMHGGAERVDANVINNQILYVGQDGRSISSMTYELPDSGYTITNASALSAHLLSTPRKTAVFNPRNNDGYYYLVVNDDGTLAVFQVLLEENIKAWTLSETMGDFIDVASTGNEANALVKRRVNTGSTIGGTVDSAYTANDDFYRTADVTVALNSASTDVTLFATDGDYLVMGAAIEFGKMTVTLDTNASADIELVFSYLNNEGDWITFVPDSDGTTGFTGNGNIEWTITNLSNWTPQIIFNGTKKYYWIRLQRTVDTLSTAPIEDTLTINLADRIYLEALDFGLLMDSVVTTTSSVNGLITGLTHLVGQRVYVYADEFPLGTYLVDSSGEITISTVSAAVVVGIDYTPVIVPMPAVTLSPEGYNVYEPKKIKSAYVDFYQSLGVTVMGQDIVISGTENVLTTPIPESQTGYYEVSPYLGWDPRAELEISQSYPAPMTVLGIGYRLEVG